MVWKRVPVGLAVFRGAISSLEVHNLDSRLGLNRGESVVVALACHCSSVSVAGEGLPAGRERRGRDRSSD